MWADNSLIIWIIKLIKLENAKSNWCFDSILIILKNNHSNKHIQIDPVKAKQEEESSHKWRLTANYLADIHKV